VAPDALRAWARYSADARPKAFIPGVERHRNEDQQRSARPRCRSDPVAGDRLISEPCRCYFLATLKLCPLLFWVKVPFPVPDELEVHPASGLPAAARNFTNCWEAALQEMFRLVTL
jgi:hypothetical protein